MKSLNLPFFIHFSLFQNQIDSLYLSFAYPENVRVESDLKKFGNYYYGFIMMAFDVDGDFYERLHDLCISELL